MPRKQNDLDNYDFCLRKAIAIHAIGGYLSEKGIKEEEFAKEIHFSQSTVSRWIRKYRQEKDTESESLETDAPSFEGILKSAVVIHSSVFEMIRYSVELEENEKTSQGILKTDFIKETRYLLEKSGKEASHSTTRTHVSNETHKKNLECFSETQFRLLCDPRDEESGYCYQFVIDTDEVENSAVVPFTMHSSGQRSYYGSIVAPPATHLVFLYFMQQGDFPDRGFAQFYFEPENSEQGLKFTAGVGIIHMKNDLAKSEYKRAVLLRCKEDKGHRAPLLDKTSIQFIHGLLSKAFVINLPSKALLLVDDYTDLSKKLICFLERREKEEGDQP